MTSCYKHVPLKRRFCDSQIIIITNFEGIEIEGFYNCIRAASYENLPFRHVRPTKIQTSLRIRAVWSKSVVCVKKIRITKTYLYNFDPREPHFYIVKLGFTGVYIIFLISAQNIDCGYSLEPPLRGGSNEYPQSMFCAEI